MIWSVIMNTSPVKVSRRMTDTPPPSNTDEDRSRKNPRAFINWLRGLTRQQNQQEQLREAITDYIDQIDAEPVSDPDLADERDILANALKLPDLTVSDVMLHRASIIALEINATQDEVLAILAEEQHSRLPVYEERLDNIVGTVHIKDILACLARGEAINLRTMVRDVPIVSSAMNLIDLLQIMRQQRRHMVLVVDEYGGIDGLVTLGDVLEAIIGEVNDEYDQHESESQVILHKDGSCTADGLVLLQDFEDVFGDVFSPDERDSYDTLGGLVATLAGRIPQAGEEIVHPGNDLRFMILHADGRRVTRLRILRPS